MVTRAVMTGASALPPTGTVPSQVVGRKPHGPGEFSFLVTSDTHFSDHPKDAYRLGLLDWIADRVVEYELKYVFILGDLTQLKDNHPSRLVNTLIDKLTTLASYVERVVILKGNHDYIDPSTPFFKFLTRIPKLDFIVERRLYKLDGKDVGFIPNERNFLASSVDFDNLDFVFMHQTFDGAVAENGAQLHGLDDSWMWGKKAQIYSGDIHVPQILNRVTYVGAPYHIRFGDKFIPRVLMVKDSGEEHNLFYPAPRKLVIYVPASPNGNWVREAGIRQDDQVKIRVELNREELVNWQAIRTSIAEVCAVNNIEFTKIEPLLLDGSGSSAKESRAVIGTELDVFKAYCDHNKIEGSLRKMGELIMDKDGL